MARERWLTCLLTLVVSCAGTSSGNPALPKGVTLVKSALSRERSPKVAAGDAESFGADNRAFAFDMYKELSAGGDNLCFSPFSISISLAMTYAGAKGTTADEMAGALHFQLAQSDLHRAFNAADLALQKRKDQLPSHSKGDGLTLDLVNQSWAQQGYAFRGSYLDLLATNYDAGVFLVDFAKASATRSLINGWVEQRTGSRIKQLLPSGALTSATRLVLTNAIYFKASWFYPFEPSRTESASFFAPAGERSVQMMHAVDELRYAEGPDYQAVELPYLSRDVRMLVVLPSEGRFAAVASGFDAAFYDGVRANLADYEVTLSLPKWRFDSYRALKAPLQSLGMQAAFAPGEADFSGMDGGANGLFVEEIHHETLVAVDEHGTEAAAATVVVINGDGGISISPPAVFSADRPFLFVIYDQPTAQILFVGQLVDPG